METNDSNLKPQPTGGLKLMTVFIAVLALHVVVIGGFSLKYWLFPATIDSDLADKTHKGSAKIVSDSSITDMQAPDTAATDKTAPPATDSSTDASTASTATPATAAAATPTTPAAPSTSDASAVITVPATPPTMVEDASSTAANPSTAAVQHGPVINPPDNLAPPADVTTPATPTASSVAADATPAPAIDGTPYTVKHGDSLAKIAHRHHIALAKLRTANGLASDNLHIGQKLVIPSKSAAASTTSVAETTTPAETESAATTPSVASSAKSMPEPTAPVAQPVESIDNVGTPTVASTGATHHAHHAATHHLYTVVKGDTLTKIARRYHTTTSALMAANSITNASRLSIGEKLHIPSHESRAAATASQDAAPEQPETHSATKGQLANYVQ
jgi:LysM repeat protein